MSSDLLQKHIDSANVLIDQIKSKRSLLFDSKNCVKHWKSNELKFFDEKLDTMNEKLKEIQKYQSIILANIGNIQSRLSNQSEIVAEKERSLKRKKENLKKSEKRKQNRFRNKMSEVVKKFTDNKISLENLTNKKIKISIHDLNLNINLTSRFHSEALGHMIKEDMFAGSATVEIKKFHDNMTDKSANISKIKLKCQRKKNNSEKQPTIEVIFSGEHAKKCKSSHSIVVDSSSKNSSDSNSGSEVDL